MEFRTPQGQERYDALLAAAPHVLVGLDFDGTLSPIVDDPARAVIHPDGPRVLAALASRVRAVVVVTGRPARQVVELGDLDRLADSLPAGARLEVMGQYGNERWDAVSREFTSPEPPAGLQAFRDELPGLLARENADGAYVEEKGLAVAVHTRRLQDPGAAFARLEEALADAAERHGLSLEPGRMALEVRAPGMHKGAAVRTLTEELGARAFVFCGDDLGDLEAFKAVEELRGNDFAGLLVCSGSEEQGALVELADMVVDGPGGVLEVLRELTEDIRAVRA